MPVVDSIPEEEVNAEIFASLATDMPWSARVFRMKDPDEFLWAISSER